MRTRPTTLVAAALLAAAPALAQDPSRFAIAGPDGRSDAARRADSLVRAIMTEPRTVRTSDGSMQTIPTNVPGMSAAVLHDGRLVWSGAFGWADVERGVAVVPGTKFRIGSISKVFTVAALARLAERGRLDWDAPVRRYVPAFPRKRHDFTVRQLAGHLAGIRHYRDDDPVGTRRFARLADGLAVFADDSLLFAPGTRYLYSSYGYNLLGVVVEAAAGTDYLRALGDEVLRPLGLRATVADHRDSLVLQRAAPYVLRPGGQVLNGPYEDVSYKWPSGGLLSTAEELARFGDAHLRPGFLGAETLRVLFTPQRLASGEATGVGIGWRVGTDRAGRRIVHHAGASSTGGRAVLVLYPDDGLVVAMLANVLAPFGEEDAARLAALFLADRPAPATKSP